MRYTVQFRKACVEVVDVEVEADNEDAARKAAEAMIENDELDDKDWDTVEDGTTVESLLPVEE